MIKLCVKKVKNDNQVVELFDELRSSMPRLESWESIYPTDTMQKLVAEAYVQIIDFARKAAEYLSKFWSEQLLYPGHCSGTDAVNSQDDSSWRQCPGLLLGSGRSRAVYATR